MSAREAPGDGLAGTLPAFGLALLVVVALSVLSAPAAPTGTGALEFDPALAHLLVTGAAILYCGYCLFRRRTHAGEPPLPEPVSSGGAVTLALVTGVVVLLLYFPPFLARYGPYGEDKYFLSALLRAHAGQRPYLDFEFLYGPLLFYPLGAWLDAFGFTLTAYYWFLALVEALTYAGLAFVIGRRLPGRRDRVAALLLLASLLINDNLGLSWIALRRLLPVGILMVHAGSFEWRRGWALTGLLLGVQVVLSLEYALATIAALLGAAALESLLTRRLAAAWHTGKTLTTGLAVGGVLAFAMMGSGTIGWLEATSRVITLRGAGEAAFRFGPSVNAFAVFSLVFLACGWLGSTIRGAATRGFGPWERALAASVGYAIVALKSGLARSDMYHLVPPILGIALLLLLPLISSGGGPRRTERRAALLALLLVVVTYLPGLAGAGRLWARGLVLGGRDVLSGRPSSGAAPARARGPVIGAERSESNPDRIALAEYLADPSRMSRPVFYYERTWAVDKMIGVAKPAGLYATDDYLISDAAGEELRGWLETHADALVIVERTAWNVLHHPDSAPAYVSMFWLGRERSWPTRVLEFWSSSHYGTATIEERTRKRDRWERTVGRYLRDGYQPLAEFGSWIVLSRSGSG